MYIARHHLSFSLQPAGNDVDDEIIQMEEDFTNKPLKVLKMAKLERMKKLLDARIGSLDVEHDALRSEVALMDKEILELSAVLDGFDALPEEELLEFSAVLDGFDELPEAAASASTSQTTDLVKQVVELLELKAEIGQENVDLDASVLRIVRIAISKAHEL
ncbi:hypothetical protein RHGRI_033157 [Rhododendron griersonianum]|uniref:Uncharacterized protein n=1 Tax=Rhododendron griersonianum TaxID=479676 RepID=A0AAV6HYU7_9ERIC|nr:hypothetical protein RHGRI_033157 [Rhododendron griersonianum]